MNARKIFIKKSADADCDYYIQISQHIAVGSDHLDLIERFGNLQSHFIQIGSKLTNGFLLALGYNLKIKYPI